MEEQILKDMEALRNSKGLKRFEQYKIRKNLKDDFYKFVIQNNSIRPFRNDKYNIRGTAKDFKSKLNNTIEENDLLEMINNYIIGVKAYKEFLNRNKVIKEKLENINEITPSEKDIELLIEYVKNPIYRNSTVFDEILNKAKKITGEETLIGNINKLNQMEKDKIEIHEINELGDGVYRIIPIKFSISSSIYKMNNKEYNDTEDALFDNADYLRLLKYFERDPRMMKTWKGYLTKNNIGDIKTEIIGVLNNVGDFYSIDDIDLIKEEEYYDNENNNCLEMAIKETTGKEYKKSNINEILNNINEYKDTMGNIIGIYNKYGNLIGGNRFNEYNNIILFENHAIAIHKPIESSIRINKEKIILSKEEAYEILGLINEKKIYLLYPCIFRNREGEIIELSGIVPNIFNELFNVSDKFISLTENAEEYYLNRKKTEIPILYYKICYKWDVIDVNIIKDCKTKEEAEIILKGENENFINDLWEEKEEKEMINFALSEWENYLMNNLNNDCFLENYRKRNIYFQHINNDEEHEETDMKKAYLTAYNEMLKNGIINVLPFPINNYEHVKNKAFIFYASNCKPYKEGYYYGKYYKVFNKIEGVKITFYIISEKIENIKFDSLEKINKEMKNIYKKFIGKLIQTSNYSEYNIDNFLNEAISGISFRHNRLSILHLNIMLNLNEILFNEVIKNYKEKNILPIDYNVDSIIYRGNNEIKENDYFKGGMLRTFEPKNKGINYELEEKFIYGCAGCGKTYKIQHETAPNDLFIVGKHMLNNEVYKKQGLRAYIYSAFKVNFNVYNCSRIIIDEIFTFSIKEQCELISMANYYEIPYVLIGDYNQLLPIKEERGKYKNVYLEVLEDEQILKYCCDNYIIKNYRNNFNFGGSEEWIIKAINGMISNEEYIKIGIEKKKKELYNKLINEGYITFNDNIEGLRWYKQTAINQYEKIQNGEIKFDKYILNNVIGKNKIGSGKYKEIIFKAGISYDTFYSLEDLKKLLGKHFEKCFKYFINLNCISSYNTQGLSLEKVNIINKEEGEALKKNMRMFYVLISRIKN